MLVLHGNQLGAQGGLAVGRLLGANTALQEVFLWGNRLGCDGSGSGSGLGLGLGLGLASCSGATGSGAIGTVGLTLLRLQG